MDTEAKGRRARAAVTVWTNHTARDTGQASTPARAGRASPASDTASPPRKAREKAHRVSRLARGAMRDTEWKYTAVRGVVNTMAPRVVDRLANTNSPASLPSRGQKPSGSLGSRARSLSFSGPVNR